jgi:signal transduction histidine kinase/ligand-binding sensor domain-containing protein
MALNYLSEKVVAYWFYKMKFSFSFFLLVFTGLTGVYGQAVTPSNPEMGHPLFRLYAPSEYDAHGQNFAITQDKAGVMYFGNFAGVLEYDGVTWTTIQTEDVTRVSALLTDRNGRVLVGGNGEFGYLAYDSLGVHRFVSLSKKIKEKIGSIHRIVETHNGVWFISSKQYFFWDGKTIKVRKSNSTTQAAFVFNDKLLVFTTERGPLLIDGENIFQIQRAEGVPVLLDMVSAIPLDSETAMIATTSQGIFLLSGTRLEPLRANANDLLIQNGSTYATKLKDGTIAISMVRGGMLIVSSEGTVLYSIPAGGVIQDSQVSHMFTDRDDNLWLALNDGIARVNVPSPITRFDNVNGLKGEVTAIGRYHDKLYIGTLYGLFYINNNRIVQVSSFSGSCLGFQKHGNSLLISTNKGVVEWQEGGGSRHLNDDFTLSLTVSETNPNNIYVGLQDGLGILSKNGSAWNYQRVKGITEQIVATREFPRGSLWLETLSNYVIKYDIATGTIKRYGAGQGLTSPLYNKLSMYDGRLVVSNKDGIFVFQTEADRFVPFPLTSEKNAWFDRLVGDAAGNIWGTRGDKKFIALYKKQTGKPFMKVDAPFLPISQIPFQVVYTDQDNVAWTGGDQGLYRLDMSIDKQYVYKYPVLLRRVTTPAGNILTSVEETPRKSGARTYLDYQQNGIAFEYALPSYHINQDLQYQYQLENFDQAWSEWSPITRKEYSGLPAGNYIFKVRGRDIYNNISQEASFSFTILTPWYLKWYMIALYAIAFAVLIYFGVRYRLEIILREKQALENLIKERTEEVVSQKEELEQQSEELSATNDQLERIDEFVKSINSEVNTRKLFQLVLNKLCEFQNVDAASALILDKTADNYQFIALAGSVDLSDVEDVRLTREQIMQRYTEGGVEVYEDIFLKNNFRFENLNNSIDELFAPKSLISILIRVDGDVKSLITLENMDRENAFHERDFNMMKNLKEHLIGAYIKTNILENLENTLTNLKSTQEELIRQERLASVGQLTKGIVDRILNPLNYINNFSQSSGKLILEIEEVTDRHLEQFSEDDRDDFESGMQMLRKNLEKIYEHGNSTTRIVKDMQKLLKGKSTEFFVTDLNPFLESKARSAFQEVINEYKGVNVRLTFDLCSTPVKVSILPYEFSQVLTNLISNACYAVIEKARINKNFEPHVEITSALIPSGVGVQVKDNGGGIPPKEIEQLFSPFFTTKPTSKGTGLGLYMSKDIIEYHKGKMAVNSKEGEFTEISVCLPVVD